MTNNQGLTDREMKRFVELCIKANDEQLVAMSNYIPRELKGRKVRR